LDLEKIDKEISEHRRHHEFLIDPFGKIYRYKGDIDSDMCIHYQIARRIVPSEIKYPLDYLYKCGWVIVSDIMSWRFKKINQAQQNTIDKYVLEKDPLYYKETLK
jgi:hypothetical protein